MCIYCTEDGVVVMVCLGRVLEGDSAIGRWSLRILRSTLWEIQRTYFLHVVGAGLIGYLLGDLIVRVITGNYSRRFVLYIYCICR